MEVSQQKPHAIMVPYPLLGHVNPFVNLAIKLASKGFTITFINTESMHHQITKSAHFHLHGDDDIFFEARKSGSDIHYATVSDGFPLEFNRFLNLGQFLEGNLHPLPALVDDLVGKIVQADPSVNCLISDTFFVWPSMIADKYKLVSVSFWTEPALVYNLYFHWDLLKINGHFDCPDNRKDTIDYIPGVDAIEPSDLISYLQANDATTMMHRVLYKAIFEDAKKADFIVGNTVQELESKTISALQEKQPFYAIGPIFPTTFTKSIVATSIRSESDCTHWLTDKPNRSVLYVSFGSYGQCSKEDFVEIANGLLLSEVNFIWVLRPDSVSYSDTNTNILPIEIESKIEDRGLIVPWCSQKLVLSHPSVGGFITHCGWNSILESMWCGIPLLCYPLWSDQITNKKLVVDDWKIGLNLCDRKPITRHEVAEKIKSLMSGKSADDLRNNMKQVKRTLDVAISGTGSSEKNFNQLISDVKTKIQKKKGSIQY